MKYIGIIGRLNGDRITYNQEIIQVIYDYGYIPLGIIVTFTKDSQKELNLIQPLLNLCSGFILQGGNAYYEIDTLIVQYLYQKNIPTLGICLGMQTMAMCFNGEMGTIGISHKSNEKYVHIIDIVPSSKLFEIVQKDKIMVNSRHQDYIIKTDLDISAKANIIEAIEDKTKKFFLGVQWHPETLRDENSENIFKNFFFSIN